jgi:hypothetical protein
VAEKDVHDSGRDRVTRLTNALESAGICQRQLSTRSIGLGDYSIQSVNYIINETQKQCAFSRDEGGVQSQDCEARLRRDWN